jgi:hypothetical protein
MKEGQHNDNDNGSSRQVCFSLLLLSYSTNVFLQIHYTYGTGTGGLRRAATKEGQHNDNGSRRFLQYVDYVYILL